jgi:hypothetical protein
MLNLAQRLAVAKYFMAFVYAAHALVADPVPVDKLQRAGRLELAQSTRAPKIVHLFPKKGAIGTVAAIKGGNFTSENNVIEFRGEKDFAAGSPVGSKDGTSLQFRITSCPSYQPQCPGVYIPPGVYHVSVINAGGESNSVRFSLVRRKTP